MAGKFGKTLRIWSQKPHVVNKRLAGVAAVASWKCVSEFPSWENIIEIHQDLKGCSESEICEKFKVAENWSSANNWIGEEHEGSECYASLRRCLPKQPNRHRPVLELEFIDLKLQCAVFIPLTDFIGGEKDHLISMSPYAIVLNGANIDLKVFKEDLDGHWLTTTVLPKLRKWFLEMEDETTDSMESLRLVSIEAYNNLYQELKRKYVPNISEIWPECTDPQKFIHEDVAIATYLILLWRKEREELKMGTDYRQSFIDIGCGNGLLVYLLASEGYPGKGIDIRARKIWGCYPKHTQLEVSTLIPSEETYFLDYDWLLGNHSDELTPWLPVMALQSSVKRVGTHLPTRYWVLPCCPFSFWGKFQREKFSSSNGSRYAEYLRFVGDVGRTCGFQVEEDRMRIPSTRRICFVGSFKMSADNYDWESLLQSKSKLIASSKTGIETTAFVPRDAVEPIRNCTRIDRGIQEEIVNMTAKFLLERRHSKDKGKWNHGGEINLTDLVEMISKDFKNFHLLKSECGGIQTLLRNHSHIFVVQNKAVRFRSPTELSAQEWRNQQNNSKTKKTKRTATNHSEVKRKECWFFVNHPDGCPLENDLCRYIH